MANKCLLLTVGVAQDNLSWHPTTTATALHPGAALLRTSAAATLPTEEGDGGKDDESDEDPSC